MEEDGQEDARNKEVGSAKLRRDVKIAKLVILLVIRSLEGAKQTKQGKSHSGQTQKLDKVIKPVTRFIKWKIACIIFWK